MIENSQSKSAIFAHSTRQFLPKMSNMTFLAHIFLQRNSFFIFNFGIALFSFFLEFQDEVSSSTFFHLNQSTFNNQQKRNIDQMFILFKKKNKRFIYK